MILTDEEIMDVVLDEGLGVVADEDTRAIAKAQLKKDLEWLDGHFVFGIPAGIDNAYRMFQVSEKEYQSLLDASR